MAAALGVLLLGAAPSAARADDARTEAIDMASITVAHALCGFDLSDAQEDAIVKRRQALVDAGALSASEIDAIEAELTTAMQRQVPEGLCKAGGAQERLYRRQLDALGRAPD